MHEPHRAAAPNYTNAALIMAAVNLIWVFCVLWAVFGFAPVIVLAMLLNHGITLLRRRRAWKGSGSGYPN